MTKSLLSQINALLKSGRADQAVRGLEAALKKDPRNIALWLVLAQVHGRGTRRFDRVLMCAQKVITIDKTDHRGWLEAARALTKLERPDEALSHAHKAKKRAPKDPETGLAVAIILADLNRLEEADRALCNVLELAPGNLAARVQHAQILLRRGDLEDGRTAALAVQADHPDHTPIYTVLNNAGTWPQDDPALAYLEQTLIPIHKTKGSPHFPQLAKILAKAKNDQGDHHGAMSVLKQAKSAEPQTFDIAAYGGFVNRLTKGIGKASYLGHPGLADETAVLIVGMPRSGSTLLSQILDGHPQVVSAGESPALPRTLAEEKIASHTAASQLDLLATLTPERRAQIGKAYLKRLSLNLPNAARVVDKRLHNFENLAVLAACLPKVRILHTTRDPLDTCVSCYMSPLPSGHGYTRDLGGLGQYYKHYQTLMDHWVKTLPNPILTVAYEDTVADLEAQARRVIAFLGLDWDPACLDYRDNVTSVRTLSKWQVRQPVYTTSVQRWRRYEDDIGPLKDALASLYPDVL